MRIEIWSDYVCPFCYIGKRQLEIALEKFPHRNHVLIQLKSFQLQPAKETTEDVKVEKLLADKYSVPIEQIRQRNDQIKNQAAEIGLTLNFEKMKQSNTIDAHRLVKHAADSDREKALAELLFTAYFTEGRNIGDHSILIDLAGKAGLNKKDTVKILESRKYTNAVHEDIAIANEIGVQGVPFFVFNEKYALSGAQTSSAFLEVLETVWNESDEKTRKRQITSKRSSYCCGVDNCVEDDKN